MARSIFVSAVIILILYGIYLGLKRIWWWFRNRKHHGTGRIIKKNFPGGIFYIAQVYIDYEGWQNEPGIASEDLKVVLDGLDNVLKRRFKNDPKCSEDCVVVERSVKKQK